MRGRMEEGEGEERGRMEEGEGRGRRISERVEIPYFSSLKVYSTRLKSFYCDTHPVAPVGTYTSILKKVCFFGYFLFLE